MQEFLMNLFTAVVTAAVPVIAGYVIVLIRKDGDNAAAETEDIKVQGYTKEIANAIADAVAATSQTYVDALKNAGEFTLEAQKEALQKSLTACIASISPAAQAFIESAYGDITEYLTTKIEAEVRKQKLAEPLTIALPAVESDTSPSPSASAAVESETDTTAIAASTAAATAATIAQTAVNQLKSEPTVQTAE